jgi:TnpA family transposase
VRSVWSLNDLKRFATNKQLTLLASCVLVLYGELLDNIVLMFDRLASKMNSRVQTRWQEQTLKRFTQNRAHRDLIIQAAEAFAQPVECVLKSHSLFDIDALKRALQDNSARGDKDEIDKSKLMVSKIHHFRSILSLFLNTSPQVGAGHEALKTAMDFAKTATKKWVPLDIPHFIEKKYISIALEPEGIRRDIWEWFLVMHMVSRLRAHDIYFPYSVKHKGFWERLDSQEVPEENRDPAPDVARLLEEFKSEFKQFKDSLKDNSFVKIVEGKIQLSRDLGLGDPVSTKLHDQVQQSLPKIRIEDLISEIDKLTHFSQAFKHHSTHEPLDESRKHILYASLIAHATNIGVSGMASASEGISVDMLEDICKGYQSADCVREAIRVVNNYQATLEAGNVWGDGSMSSSDGQMFRVHGKSLHVEYHPRRFGVGRGINVVTHQSDREVVLATIVLACSKREWHAVLDGLLGNNSEISPKIHTTDTHGYSDHLFALCWLLDIVFAPRIKDAGDSRLWLPSQFDAENLTPIFEERNVSLSNLANHWEPVQRIVSALKQGLIDGQTVTMRLANASGDPVANALLDLGRLVKTTFLLRWMRDQAFRQSLQAQLNKGESRHFLARSVNFASGTGYRSADPLDLMHRTSILSLVCNIIVTWNTIAIGNLITSMKSSEAIDNDLDISSITPLICGHIARTGTYRFKQEVTQ